MVCYGSTLRYGFLRYVTLREDGKQALRYGSGYGDVAAFNAYK